MPHRAAAMRVMRQFMAEEAAQDLIEYSLLLAAVALAATAAISGTGTSVNSMWSILNSRVAGS